MQDTIIKTYSGKIRTKNETKDEIKEGIKKINLRTLLIYEAKHEIETND